MRMEFKNKVAVITGGGTGIGRATGIKLAKEGCHLVLLGRRTDETQVQEVFAKIGKNFGKIDYLVNNAGINTRKNFESITEDDVNKEINVKTKGIIFCSRAVLPFMKNGGAIVNLSSITTHTGSANSSPAYAAGNAIASNLTKSLALQLAKYGIRVNAVAPGFTYPTGFTKDYEKEILAKMAETSPLKRLCTPEDVANGIYFLLSNLSSFVNGHTLDINGGFWMN